MRSLIAALLLATCATSAHAQNPHIQVIGQVLYLTGPIEYGDQAIFDGAVKANDVRTIVLSSGGGLVDQALTMAKLIHERGLTTVIPGSEYCASACAMMFLAGDKRAMGAAASLGLHSAIDQTGVSTAGTTSMTHFLTDLAVAPLDIIYAVGSTPPSQMYWLPLDRRPEMGITTVQ